ncbi:hypothetical protein Goshw_018432 [Gossypium schwendimanii]|uniref:DUF4283 domain-containing protein n=1 Tax=Gossypium schwendimanii TaxID=34291 RepID=A0A7J9NAD3_GOSSC|nr:hypothetical protein [Gossypium schwendimanii]
MRHSFGSWEVVGQARSGTLRGPRTGQNHDRSRVLNHVWSEERQVRVFQAEGDKQWRKKIYNLWKPLSPFHLMDIENGYFLPKFNNKLGYKKALSKGSWITFGQYLKSLNPDLESILRRLKHYQRWRVLTLMTRRRLARFMGHECLLRRNLGGNQGIPKKRKQTNSPRPLDYGSFLNLRENKLMLDIKLSQEIGSSTGITVSEDLPIHYFAVKKFGRQQQSVTAITGSEIKVWTGDGGSGLVEVPIADSNGGLNPNRHTTITFKEVKKSSDRVSTERGTILVLGVENFKTLGKILGENVGGAWVSKIVNKIIHERGIRFKVNSVSKHLLRDTMTLLAESISTKFIEELGQGCTSSKILHVFCEFNVEHNPDIVSVGTESKRPDRGRRKSLWDDLVVVLPQDPILWMIMDDFNAILSPNDKKSDRGKSKRCTFFSNFVDSCNLQDLWFIGLAFTWKIGNIYERLDRALANDTWVSSFPHCIVYHLPLIKSDHRPILLRTKLILVHLKEDHFSFS